jgi:ketosteroid isomerase-like protein
MEHNGMRAGLLGLIVIVGAACSPSEAPMDESMRTQIAEAVQQRVRSFEAAERALDAEALVSHFSTGPAFYIYSDGQRLTYDVMSTAVRGVFPTLRSIEGGFEDIDIMVLSPDTALVTAAFQETVTDRGGNQVVQHGSATWLWRQVEGGWQIAYGHVDHYQGERQR